MRMNNCNMKEITRVYICVLADMMTSLFDAVVAASAIVTLEYVTAVKQS